MESGEQNRVLLGVTGSIAAYKAVELARLLVSSGYHVKVVMTKSATEFVGAATFEAVTGSAVAIDFWEGSLDSIEHIELADWADVFVIAPATADVIAKLAQGISDTPLLAVALACKAPLLIAPAMNVNMLQHPATIANIELLKNRGVSFTDAEVGDLACGWVGAGRLAASDSIFADVRKLLSNQDFLGRKLVVSAGPTREAIDPIRFITNTSSGKMGFAIAAEARRRGAEVVLVHGPVSISAPKGVYCIPVTSALEMRDVLSKEIFESAEHPDCIIMTAAVGDFRVDDIAAEKIKKNNIKELKLINNPDILAEVGAKLKETQKSLLVGFAVETGEVENLIEEATKKLNNKHLDMIVANLANESLGSETNHVWMISKTGKQDEIPTSSKSRVANKILDSIGKML